MDTNYYNGSYYEKVQQELKHYEHLWGIKNLKVLLDTPSSCVLKGTSDLYGPIILKKRSDTKTIRDEYHALSEYNGKRFCKAYEADLEAGVLLEEQIIPGTVLKDEESLDKRLEVFCDLFRGLHVSSSDSYNYPTYLDWVIRITAYMEELEEFKELTSHMKKAESLCKDLFKQYPPNMLLHGDLHHYNILLSSYDSYKIIDPKGVIGHPIFDIPRFILNELEETITPFIYEKIKYCITVISTSLNISIEIIKKCFYIETTMAECWHVESNLVVHMDHILLAENILNDETFI